MKRECETWQLLSDVTSLAAAAMAVFSDMETFLEDFPEFEGRDTVLDFYFGLRDFLNVYELLVTITGSTRRTWESLPLK